MFQIFRSTVCAVALLVAGTSFARPLSVEEKIRDLDQLVSMIKSGYGPLEYKKTKFGIDVERLSADYYLKLRATTTNLEFYYLLGAFIAEFKDSHFGGRIPTDYASKLGFTVDLVEGKVLIDEIDREKLPEAEFPYKKGDELVKVDGKPVQDLIEYLSKYIGMGYDATTKRIAAMTIANRRGSRVPVPTGAVSLEIVNDAGISSVKASKWFNSGTELENDTVIAVNELIAEENELEALAFNPNRFKLSTVQNLSDFIDGMGTEYSFQCSGDTRTVIPSDATIIIEKPFVAYYHPMPGHPETNIGYLRIPHYSPDMEDDSPNAYEIRFAQYQFAVSELEKHTDGLIIDQDHNCGGSVIYLEEMVGLFAHDTYHQIQFELLATKNEYLDFSNWLSSAPEHTLDHVYLKQTVDLIKDTWLNGRGFLTTKTGLMGNKVYRPNEVRYTKPILMLIDEMSGSGGDAFPSVMKGIGRAKLMGQRTMGAGGHVTEQPLLNYSGLNVHMTKSLFYRPDGVPVENNGAEPDFLYAPTKADFVGKYADYQKVYLNKIFEMVTSAR
jgi:hypothetical protein